MQDNDFESAANNYLPILNDLAAKLHSKVEANVDLTPPTVLVFVGAGPSKAADLPLASLLISLIEEEFISKEPEGAKIRELLKDEIHAEYGANMAPRDLSLFEFAAVVSRFHYGQKVIRKTIQEHLNKPTHRPLSYELLAHLAKHRYLDHFIILNFDRLLDQALEDELPERVKVVASPQDIPSKSSQPGQKCFAVHPFGILGEGPYSLTTDDVAKFGPGPIREFIEDRLLERSNQPVILILLGYRAEEPAFRRFLRAQQEKWRRPIHVYVIDPDENACRTSNNLCNEGVIMSVQHIGLRSDAAIELLFELLRLKWIENRHHVWVTAARHKILSKLFSYDQLQQKNTRFKIELLLQGLKSRGFVHLEAFGHVPRLKNYGSEESSAVIKELLYKKVLTRDKWQESKLENESYVPNFMIKDKKLVIEEFLLLSRPRNANLIDEWRVEEEGGKLLVRFEPIKAEDFLEREFDKIQRAPEIEIVADVTPEVNWILGSGAKALSSIDALTRKTRTMIESALTLSGPGKLRIMGIWSTGEWLFHPNGWAYDLGGMLLGRSDVEIRILVTKPGGVTGDRSRRRDAVKDYVLGGQKADVELRWLNWWELNRIMTLVQCKDGTHEAIYMRRRLSRPLVCPYFIEHGAEDARQHILELWDVYWGRGEPADTSCGYRPLQK